MKTVRSWVGDCWWRAVWRFCRNSHLNIWRSEPYREEVKPTVNHSRSVLPVMTKNLLYKSETVNNQQIITNKNAMSFKSLKKVLLHPNVTLSYIKNHPRALSRAIKLTVYSRFPIGTNIFERDWDVMIVLDACRVDSMEAVVNEYAFLPSTVSKITSRASSTIEWVSQTFTTKYEDEISKTVYVSANPWPERILSGEESTEGYYSAGFAPTKWDTVTPDTFQEFYTILPEGDQRHRHVGEKKNCRRKKSQITLLKRPERQSGPGF